MSSAAPHHLYAVGTLTDRGTPFRVREHPAWSGPEAQREVCAALGVTPEQTVKTLAFTTPDDRLVLVAVPGHARLRYGAVARAAGVRRADLAPAGAERLAALGAEPGGVCPVVPDEDAVVIVDASVPGMGPIHCGSGRADTSIEIDACDLLAAVPGAVLAEVTDVPAPVEGDGAERGRAMGA